MGWRRQGDEHVSVCGGWTSLRALFNRVEDTGRRRGRCDGRRSTRLGGRNGGHQSHWQTNTIWVAKSIRKVESL